MQLAVVFVLFSVRFGRFRWCGQSIRCNRPPDQCFPSTNPLDSIELNDNKEIPPEIRFQFTFHHLPLFFFWNCYFFPQFRLQLIFPKTNVFSLVHSRKKHTKPRIDRLTPIMLASEQPSKQTHTLTYASHAHTKYHSVEGELTE